MWPITLLLVHAFGIIIKHFQQQPQAAYKQAGMVTNAVVAPKSLEASIMVSLPFAFEVDLQTRTVHMYMYIVGSHHPLL
jgi:hypothetical protein